MSIKETQKRIQKVLINSDWRGLYMAKRPLKENGIILTEVQSTTKNTNEKTAILTYLSIITLTMNEVKTPIKRHRLAQYIKKSNLSVVHKKLSFKN